MANAAEDVRAVREILLVDVTFRTEVVQGDFEQHLNVVRVDLVSCLNIARPLAIMSMLTLVTGRKLPRMAKMFFL